MPSHGKLRTSIRDAIASTVIALAACHAPTSRGQSTGADIKAGRVTGAPCATTWGPANGAYGFVGAVTGCNISVDTALHGSCCGATQNHHPAVAFHLYQLKRDPFERFQQIGISWMKHDDWFGGVNLCESPGCTVAAGALGPGCSDTYTVNEQALGPLGPRWGVNAFTGYFPMDGTFTPAGCPDTTCCTIPSSDPLKGYLQVNGADLRCPPLAQTQMAFFLEAHFVAEDDSAAGNQFNNVSYVPVRAKWVYPASLDDCTSTCGATECTWWLDSEAESTHEEPAIHAWKAGNPPSIPDNPSVVETTINVPGEGRFVLAALATKIDADWWSYEYALYNMNSDRSAGALRVALPSDLSAADLQDIRDTAGFHNVDYHDGDGVACPSCECSGGSNSGAACNVPTDCQSGGICKQHCLGGFNNGGLCSTDAECRVCVGGTNDGLPCAYEAACPGGGTCDGGTCKDRLNFDGADWLPATVGSGSITWAAPPYTANPNNANALRWGTLYNFRFEGKRAPICDSTVTIDLFKPGTPTSVTTGSSIAPAPLGPGTGCIATAAPHPVPGDTNKNRVLSIIPATCSTVPTAIRVKMLDLQTPVPGNGACCPAQNFHAWDVGDPPACSSCTAEVCPAAATPQGVQGGCARWVGKPGTYYESQENHALGSFRAARLQCTPFYLDWSTEPVIHVTGAEIIPSSTYAVQMIAYGCDASNEGGYSPPLTMNTSRHGDIAAVFNPPGTTTQPDAIDVLQLVHSFKHDTGAPSKTIAQVQPNVPDLNADINAIDISLLVDAVKFKAYPQHGPCPCPSPVPCGAGEMCTSDAPCITAYGAAAKCVKTCTGGTNDGEPCVNSSHCPPTGVGTCGNPFCRDACGRCTP
jgi:hypothetical protein